MELLMQQGGTSAIESLQVRMAAADAGLSVEAAPDIPEHWPDEPFLPVGSVEFCLAAFRHQGVDTNSGMPPYPEPLRNNKFLARGCTLGTADGVLREGRGTVPTFVRPDWPPKAFPATVLSPEEPLFPGTLLDLPDATPVWYGDVVRFVSEWRYYIGGDAVLGCGRYDDGADDAPVPNAVLISEAVAAMGAAAGPAGYALDFGVLDNGRTALVEANDGWALGFYRGTLRRGAYLDLLMERGREILGSRHLHLRSTSNSHNETRDPR